MCYLQKGKKKKLFSAMVRNAILRKEKMFAEKVRPGEEEMEQWSRETRWSSRAERITQGTEVFGAQSAKSFRESRFLSLQ